MPIKVNRKFDPRWDLAYIYDANDYRYAVVKDPEPIPGMVEMVDGKEVDVPMSQLFVKEGCIVMADGRWFYWRLKKPMKWESFKAGNSFLGGQWMDLTDNAALTPDFIFANRINKGQGTVGHPAPEFRAREDNDWVGYDMYEVPNNVASDQLEDLQLAELILSEYLRDGVEDPKKAKKAVA
jgi:hypothetical protein